jgi:hypothetical protein
MFRNSKFVMRGAKMRAQFALATKFCTVAPNICGSSVWDLPHVPLLEARLLKWLLDFGKFVHPFPSYNI